MKKVILFAIIAIHLTFSGFSQQVYTCRLNNTTLPTLVINGVQQQYNQGTINITLPLGVNSITAVAGYTSLTCNLPQGITMIPRTNVEIRQNGQLVSRINGIWDNATTTFSLSSGLNTVKIYGDCTDGTSAPQTQPCLLGQFVINVTATLNIPFTATIIKECHSKLEGPTHNSTVVYTGKSQFKVNYSPVPTANTHVQIFKVLGGVETLAESFLANASNNGKHFTNLNNGFGTGTYKIKFVNNGTELLPSNYTNAFINTIPRFDSRCAIMRRIDKPAYFFKAAYAVFKPDIAIPNLGDIAGKVSSGINLSVEMALPNKKVIERKLIPAFEFGVSYNTLSYENGINMLTKKYPALAASESKMMNAFTEKVSNKLLVVSLTPKLVMPLGKLNISAGAGLAYIRHGFHGIDVKDELIKTNSNQPLTYAVSSGYPPPYGPRGMFGGDFKLSLSYWLTKHIALTTGSGYLLSPNYNSKMLLLNATDANGDKLYSPSELRNGTMQLQEYNYSLRGFRGNVGLQIALSKRHAYNGHVTLLR